MGLSGTARRTVIQMKDGDPRSFGPSRQDPVSGVRAGDNPLNLLSLDDSGELRLFHVASPPPVRMTQSPHPGTGGQAISGIEADQSSNERDLPDAAARIGVHHHLNGPQVSDAAVLPMRTT